MMLGFLVYVLYYFILKEDIILYLFKLFIIIGIDIRRLMVIFFFGKNSIRVLSFWILMNWKI